MEHDDDMANQNELLQAKDDEIEELREEIEMQKEMEKSKLLELENEIKKLRTEQETMESEKDKIKQEKQTIYEESSAANQMLLNEIEQLKTKMDAKERIINCSISFNNI